MLGRDDPLRSVGPYAEVLPQAQGTQEAQELTSVTEGLQGVGRSSPAGRTSTMLINQRLARLAFPDRRRLASDRRIGMLAAWSARPSRHCSSGSNVLDGRTSNS